VLDWELIIAPLGMPDEDKHIIILSSPLNHQNHPLYRIHTSLTEFDSLGKLTMIDIFHVIHNKMQELLWAVKKVANRIKITQNILSLFFKSYGLIIAISKKYKAFSVN
jgi:hypothetical protein